MLAEVFQKYVTGGDRIEREWFFTAPPPLFQNINELPRPPGSPKFVNIDNKTLFKYGSNFPNVYNYENIKNEICGGGGSFFRHYPFKLFAFKLEKSGRYPPFRFFPNVRYLSGLITNSFGFRGPEISVRKPVDTVRIAFVGASTTVNHPLIRASYPEFVGHWLNLWSRHNNIEVRFEVINAGRGGRTSQDIEAIVRTEIMPLSPDMVIYYEGSNQFSYEGLVLLPPGEFFGRKFKER